MGGGGLNNNNEDAAFIEWALNRDGKGQTKVGSRTVAVDQNPASALDSVIDKRLGPADEQDPLNRTRADCRDPNHGMPSRWKVPNEVLFLRVREIHDHVSEDIREPWFNRKCLFRVPDANPVASARGRVPLN